MGINIPMRQHSYVRLGQLNIGAILPIHEFDEDRSCGSKLRDPRAVQEAEAIVYAIDKINNDPSLLPNVTLGFVILDNCAKDTTALAQVMHFMPLKQNRHDVSSFTRLEAENQSLFSMKVFYDVIGVLGAKSSKSSIMIAPILELFKIPQISPTSSSDLLSDSSRYPYFFRIVTPDRFQVRAIVDIISHFRWTYISIIYSGGGYGREGAKLLQKLVQRKGTCVATSTEVSQSAQIDRYDHVIRKLRRNPMARAVVLFTDIEEARGVLDAAKRVGASKEFIWIGSDGLGLNLDSLKGREKQLIGSLTIKSYTGQVPDFHSYFESLNPRHDVPNPWFKEMWNDSFNCSYFGSSSTCRGRGNIRDSPIYHPDSAVSYVIDGVYAFAYALHNMINAVCPEAKGKAIRQCVTGETYLRFIKNISFPGYTGHVKFDQNGDDLGKYEILNLQRKGGQYRQVRVGLWDARKSYLQINESSIVWRINGLPAHRTPRSSCGKTCSRGEIYTYEKGTCCWRCTRCDPNEITIDNSTRCETCPTFHWPTRASTTCEPIPPSYARWRDCLTWLLATLAIIGLICSITIFVLFLKHRDSRLVKSSSKELSFIMLLGVCSKFLLVFSFIAKPTFLTCYVNHVGFSITFTFVYAPLITKTNRIYRIFEAGKRTTRPPCFTSPVSQVIIVVLVITIQVGLFLLSMELCCNLYVHPPFIMKWVHSPFDISILGIQDTFINLLKSSRFVSWR